MRQRLRKNWYEIIKISCIGCAKNTDISTVECFKKKMQDHGYLLKSSNHLHTKNDVRIKKLTFIDFQ